MARSWCPSFSLLVVLALGSHQTRGQERVGAPLAAEPPATLTLGVVQLALEPELAGNLDKMLRFVAEAKGKGCRVVVFPETALYSPDGTPRAQRDAAIARLQEAARKHSVYLIFCVVYQRDDKERPFQRLLVIDPQGRIILTYDKLWHDLRFRNLPGEFLIDGVPCAATICADRWIRAVEELPALGRAKVLFECSDNYANEWLPELGWYWYVPRALRNGVFVVFANTPKVNRLDSRVGHGHSAVIAPDGKVLCSAEEESDRLLVARLDLSRATRAQAEIRRQHPLFKGFWDVGLDILAGKPAKVPMAKALRSPAVNVKIAAAQMPCSRRVADNLARMKELISAAKTKGADVVVFPELALTGSRNEDILQADEQTLSAALDELRRLAKAHELHVVYGTPWLKDGKRQNCAVVLGPDGAVLTRYAQIVVARPRLFSPGASTRDLWFDVKGVPAVVTIGGDALWTEIAELAAARGAQLHVHLAYDRDVSAEATLRRRQLWVNLASYRTFTATVNAASPAGLPEPSEPAAGGSILWDDFHRAKSGRAGGYAPHSAVPLAKAGSAPELLFAEQTVPETNPQLRILTEKTTPQMRPWYHAGMRAIHAEAAAPAGR